MSNNKMYGLFIIGAIIAIILIIQHSNTYKGYNFSVNINSAEILDISNLTATIVIDNKSVILLLDTLQSSKWKKTDTIEPCECIPEFTVYFYDKENILLQTLELYEDTNTITAAVYSNIQQNERENYYIAKRHYNAFKALIEKY